MADVFDKCAAYPVVQGMLSAGTYPYFRTVRERLGATGALLDGRRVLLAAGSDYLGLATDPRVVAAAVRATERFGVSCSGPRPLNGTLTPHEELEQRLVAFLDRPAVAVLTSGYHAQLAVAALLGRGDAVFADQRNHPALLAAARLAPAAHRLYPPGDLAALDRLLAAVDPDVGTLVVTDGVFPTGGNLCDLPGLVKLARRHRGRLLVNGAHDIGLLGPGGRGVGEHFGLDAEVDLVTGTLSTSFGALGGFVAGPAEVVAYVRHRA
ncbi:MAG TPA: pyridoxal phosphate-dependent aminotransferase family protein, partial [Pilimelia sp.]|nr:pyridoxal phosphate-dependent aminotransferase family protein [Pilimelia sp.]